MAHKDSPRVTGIDSQRLQLLSIEITLELRADDSTSLGSSGQLYNFVIGEMA